jgi:prepilin peptidase CpaA
VSVPAVCLVACIVLTAVAAVFDARTGHIPNWITLPPLVLAPLVWLAYGGLWRTDRGLTSNFIGSLVSMFLCALVPLLLFRMKAIGAGDVKLFAAIGALVLMDTGIQALFYSFCAGALFALARLAWEGKLLRTLANTLFLAVNPMLPKKYRRPIARELMTKMRFAVAIFVGTLVAALSNNHAYGLL